MSLRKAITIALALALPLVFAAPALVLAVDAKADVFKADTSASSVKWLAKKVTGQHSGTVPLKKVELGVLKGELVGGSAELDLSNLTVTDLSGKSKDDLTGHLKSPDFFDTEKFPTSRFEITSVKKLDKPTSTGETHEIGGSLTIKGKTHPLKFPARIEVSPTTVSATAIGVKVDRTLYDIRYGSGKFFQGLGDKVINDDFWIDVRLTAKK